VERVFAGAQINQSLHSFTLFATPLTGPEPGERLGVAIIGLRRAFSEHDRAYH
jgi:hypothetical protein